MIHGDEKWSSQSGRQFLVKTKHMNQQLCSLVFIQGTQLPFPQSHANNCVVLYHQAQFIRRALYSSQLQDTFLLWVDFYSIAPL